MEKDAEKTECRTPTKGREGVTRIPTWKYNAVRKAILAAIGEQGLSFSELVGAVRREMAAEDLENTDSLGGHVTTVKLNMWVLGELKRVAAKGPQRLIIT